jgi:hypothetical protein
MQSSYETWRSTLKRSIKRTAWIFWKWFLKEDPMAKPHKCKYKFIKRHARVPGYLGFVCVHCSKFKYYRLWG